VAGPSHIYLDPNHIRNHVNDKSIKKFKGIVTLANLKPEQPVIVISEPPKELPHPEELPLGSGPEPHHHHEEHEPHHEGEPHKHGGSGEGPKAHGAEGDHH
jgi:hypothetical protein